MQMTPKTTQPFQRPGAMNVIETADFLRVSRASVYRLIKTGDLKSIKVAGRRLVRPEAAEELLANA